MKKKSSKMLQLKLDSFFAMNENGRKHIKSFRDELVVFLVKI
jgi:hypothetical protein